jgi:hypothetical protein
MLRKGRGRMAVDNSCTRLTAEESEHPPLTSCSQIVLFEEQKKRTTHLLRNRTNLFVDNITIGITIDNRTIDKLDLGGMLDILSQKNVFSHRRRISFSTIKNIINILDRQAPSEYSPAKLK